MITLWTIPCSQRRTRHDDGRWIVFDDVSGESWEITPGVADLLESLDQGWQPGSPLPPRLQPFDLTPTDATALVADLVQQGLVVDASAPPAYARPSRRAWFTWSIWRAPALAPGIWRMIVMTLAAAAVASAAIVWNQVPALPGEGREAFLLTLLRETIQQPGGPTIPFLGVVVLSVFLAAVHELAHSFALTSRTGKPAAIGLRLLFGFWPRPFADVTALLTLARRADRVPVLLAGPLAEFAAWLIFLAALGSRVWTSGLFFMLFGPVVLVSNLVPLVRNDGYLVLQELTGDRDLIHSARKAAHRAFLAPNEQMRRSERWWLPWYGLIELTVVPASLVPLGILLGGLMSFPSAGAVGGLAAALGLLALRVRRIDVGAEDWPGANAA